jgi:hypothetical protein
MKMWWISSEAGHGVNEHKNRPKSDDKPHRMQLASEHFKGVGLDKFRRLSV